jgi:uncharacterized membrane protein YgdD (TMEM256/DUF423 family)
MNWIALGSWFGFLGVALGAFGAHALRDQVGPDLLEIHKTATHYLMIHSIALILFGLLPPRRSWPGWCFLSGILIFSGSLYALVLTQVRALGAITPVGGILLMSGWIGFALSARRNRETS